MSTIAHATDRRPLWFLDNLVRPLVDGIETDGAYSLAEVRGRRGDMPPLHVHHRDDEGFYVLAGELTVFAGDERITAPAGSFTLAPRDVPHAYRVESDTASWLVITNPAGFEQFVRAVARHAEQDELPEPGAATDPEALIREAAAVGIEILGPPGTLPGA